MDVTVFLKGEPIARGPAEDMAERLKGIEPPERADDLLAFDDETGRQIDLDLRPAEQRPRGRPSLGVKAREVTLLPRHWDWLSAQRGGASATLRRLVDAARAQAKTPEQCHDAAYRFLSAMAGDLPKFEDAVREIYAGNPVGYDHFTHGWPEGIRAHGRGLAFPEGAAQ
ncbi:MAG: hypothetical protein B7Y87_02810 [Sphingomonadales bacterium 32-64-22]|nr:MAG: hypothetical protein B7Y87_02810 [Sphingomonadales bacterium 32-64-22]